MKIEELIKKPVQVVVENNISDDLIYANMPMDEFVSKILEKAKSKVADFLFVYADDDKKIKAAITGKEIGELFGLIIKENSAKKVSDLSLEEKFSANFVVSNEDLIEKVVKMFNQEKTDIILVTSKDNKYLGKIKRLSLQKWFTIMIQS